MVDLQRGDYQDLDQLNAARPFVKAAYRIGRVEDIGRGVARAIRTAVSGRPGGVYLDIPGDGAGPGHGGFGRGADTIWRVVDPAPRQLPAPEAVDRALDVLAQAQRPLIVLGKGAAYAQADAVIREFVETTGIPFLPMSMAKGLLPDSHPQSAAAARSLAIARADVVLLVGARLNWLLGHGDSPQWSRRRQVHPSRHRGLGVRQQPADRGAAGRRHRLGDVGAARRPGRPSGRGAGGVDRRAGRAQSTQRRQDAPAPGRKSAPDAVLQRTRRHSLRAAAKTRMSTWSTRAPMHWTWPATSSTWSCRDTGSTPEPGA